MTIQFTATGSVEAKLDASLHRRHQHRTLALWGIEVAEQLERANLLWDLGLLTDLDIEPITERLRVWRGAVAAGGRDD